MSQLSKVIEPVRTGVILSRMLSQVILAKLTNRPRPVTVNLQVTKACNLKCDYCFADLESLDNAKNPQLDQMFETIDEVYRKGCRHIILMGGEPLANKNIGEIIRYVRSKWMRVEIVTNGYFVERHIESLKLCDSVCISLDGPKEGNDAIRGEGCHDVVLDAMKVLHDAGIKARIHAVLSRYTFKDGPRYVAGLAKKFGFKFNYSMIMLKPELRGEFLDFKEEEVIEILDGYKSLRDEGYPVFTSDACFDYMRNWPKKGHHTIFQDDVLSAEEKKWVVPCNYGRYNAFVDMDDRVYKCCLTWKNGLNWREEGMDAAIDHVGENLINCVSCRSIGDIDRALLLNFSSLSVIKMVWQYIFHRPASQNGPSPIPETVKSTNVVEEPNQ